MRVWGNIARPVARDTLPLDLVEELSARALQGYGVVDAIIITYSQSEYEPSSKYWLGLEKSNIQDRGWELISIWPAEKGAVEIGWIRWDKLP